MGNGLVSPNIENSSRRKQKAFRVFVDWFVDQPVNPLGRAIKHVEQADFTRKTGSSGSRFRVASDTASTWGRLGVSLRNIEERFIVAAPLEKYSALVWFLKRLYGWPLHRVLFQIRLAISRWHRSTGGVKIFRTSRFPGRVQFRTAAQHSHLLVVMI
jgi:hypothetical protein